MHSCKFDVINRSNILDGINSVYYSPYSVSTIKIGIKNLGDKQTTVTIGTKRSSHDDTYCGGHVDNGSDDIEISWGGGKKEGTVISLAYDEQKYAYLFVNHLVTGAPAIYDLTLQVDLKIGGFVKKYDDQDTIRIRLYPVSTKKDIIIRQTEKDYTTITFEGEMVGRYFPRWFPFPLDPKNYYTMTEIPDVQIVRELKRMGDETDKITLRVENNDIGTIAGDMDGSSFYTNLFMFNKNVFVLRFWLFWLSKNQFKQKENLKTVAIRTERGLIDFPPELPDSERYDIMFSRSGKILAVGTDYHWQEYWCEVKNAALDGVIAFPFHDYFGLVKLVTTKLEQLLNGGRENYNALFSDLRTFSKNPIWNSIDMGLDKGQVPELDSYTKVMLERDIRERGIEIFRSHVPIVRNGKILMNMLSQRVDTGV